MYKAMKEARERALNGEGATLIEAITTRMTLILLMMMIHIVLKKKEMLSRHLTVILNSKMNYSI